MLEIYADFNDIAADGTLPLTCAGSVESICRIEGGLEDGEAVWLTDGELSVEARAFRRSDGVWEARSEWDFVNRGDGRSADD